MKQCGSSAMPDNVPRRARKGRSRCGISSCCNPPRSMDIGENHHHKPVSNAVDKPYVEDLPARLDVGTCITVRGFIKPECPRFAVNLVCGRDNSDIALHINPRLSLRYMVRNTMIGGRWQEEEINSMTKFDLVRGKSFEMKILVTENTFYISINGKHHSTFVFRIPMERVKVLQVVGLVEVRGVDYGKLQSYPIRGPANVPFVVPTGDGQVTPQNLEMPIVAELPEGFQQDWQLEIYGRVKILPSAFYINLQKGTNLWPHPIIHLHLNPRFNTTLAKDALIMNAWIDGEWGQEERSASLPFSPGASFVLAIRKLDDNFSIWVDGKLIGEFRFRGPVDVINALYIQGDVVVKGLYMRKIFNDRCFSKSTLDLIAFNDN